MLDPPGSNGGEFLTGRCELVRTSHRLFQCPQLTDSSGYIIPVGGFNPLKNDAVSEFVSWDDYSIPFRIPFSEWKVNPNSMVPVTTNQLFHRKSQAIGGQENHLPKAFRMAFLSGAQLIGVNFRFQTLRGKNKSAKNHVYTYVSTPRFLRFSGSNSPNDGPFCLMCRGKSSRKKSSNSNSPTANSCERNPS